MRAFTLFLTLVLAAAPLAAQVDRRIPVRSFAMQSSAMVDADGATVSTAGFSPEDWVPATVPTTVLRALVDHGVYPDPYVGMNNMRIPDAHPVFNETWDLARYSHLPGNANPWADPWWFRAELEAPELPAGARGWLVLEGINYRADVWLNGERVAGADSVVGMFREFTIPVTGALRPGRNVLAVRIHPLDWPGLPGDPQLEVFGPFGLNGGPTGDIGKNVTMHASVGWDWIPAVRDRNMGIWQDAYLTFTGPVDVRFPHVVTDLPLPDTSTARVRISAELHNTSGESVAGALEVVIHGPQAGTARGGAGGEEPLVALRHPVTVPPGRDTVVTLDPAAYPELELADPGLWWPHTHGEPRLHELEVRFVADGHGEASDTETLRFGVREVGSEVTEEGGWLRRDFFVNGHQVELRGGAWVPDMMLDRDRRRYRDELRLSRHAGFNLVRIWGGGVTPPAEFFEIADSLGLLVWHDFWITGDVQGTWDKGTRDWPIEGDVFTANAVNAAKRLRNHPSLLVWTAGNEGYPRRELYRVLRDSIAATLDGTRPFLPTSGYANPDTSWGLSWPDDRETGAYSGGPYWWVPPAEYYRLVANGQDWLFKDEVGVPSVPPLASLRRFLPGLTADAPADTGALTDAWGYHDAAEGNGRFSVYDRALRDRYGEPTTMAEYAWKAQLLNAESYRAIFEAVNHEMERTAGVILWKTNAAWPSVAWQVYDWYLRPNAGYWFARRATRPLHAQLHPGSLAVTGVNTTDEAEAPALTVHLLDADGRVVGRDRRPVTLPPGAVTPLLELTSVPGWDPDAFRFVRLALERDGREVDDNLYWLAPDDDFTALNALSDVELEVTARLADRPVTGRDDSDPGAGAVVWIALTLANPGDRLAFFVRPTLLGPGGDEVLPTFWSDAYTSLLPGETRTLTANVDAFRLEGATPRVRIEGWNVPAREVVPAHPEPARQGGGGAP